MGSNLFVQAMERIGGRSEDVEDKPIYSSEDQINHFIESSVWKDFLNIIELRMGQKYIELESVPPEQLQGIQEALKELRFIQSIPEMLLEIKENQELNKEDDDEPS